MTARRELSPARGALSQKRLTTLAHLLGKASSDFDAEVTAAARKAHEIVRASGLTWHDILAAPKEREPRVQKPKCQPSPRAKNKRPSNRQPDRGAPCHQTDTWRDVCEQILAAGCTAWEQQFCRGLLDKWHGPLTEKQTACLLKIFMLRAGYDRRCRA
jgi:hypothetical protein